MVAFSLEAINTPSLVTGTGLATATLLPKLEQAFVQGAIPFVGLQVLNLLFYFMNAYATSQPGRIDGIEQDMISKVTKTGKPTSLFATGKRGRTLFMPQDWAFAIWGPIFAGELIFCLSTAMAVQESMPLASIIKYASGGFIGAQIFQTLWCASFRPKYDGNAAFTSSAMLSGVAYCLSRAHDAFVMTDEIVSRSQYCIHFLPLTLHFAWTTAAALVNLNGNVAAITDDPRIIAWSGHLSAIGAIAVGVFVTLSRTAPVFGGVITWALLACSAGMDKRIQETVSESQMRAGVYGAKVQKWLCGVGAAMTLGASVLATSWIVRD
jgi:hypothetical protein